MSPARRCRWRSRGRGQKELTHIWTGALLHDIGKPYGLGRFSRKGVIG
jgi:hypothetical protein